MARNADYDDAVNNLIQGGDAMVKRIEAFKANDGSLHETEKDAKLRNLIGAICKGHRAAAELHVSLRWLWMMISIPLTVSQLFLT